MRTVIPVDKLRKRAGWSIADLARAAGVSFKSASHWVAGRREPSLKNVGQIAAALEKAGIKATLQDFTGRRAA